MDQNQVHLEIHSRDEGKQADLMQIKEAISNYNAFIYEELNIDLPYLMSLKAPKTTDEDEKRANDF